MIRFLSQRLLVLAASREFFLPSLTPGIPAPHVALSHPVASVAWQRPYHSARLARHTRPSGVAQAALGDPAPRPVPRGPAGPAPTAGYLVAACGAATLALSGYRGGQHRRVTWGIRASKRMSSRFGSPRASIESDEENSLAVGPPIGARYSRKLSFPLVGSQSVSLQIDSRQTARIAMRGILNHAEELEYSFTHGNRVVFGLSDTLKSMLSKFRCSILDAWYDDVTDESCVKLRIDVLRLSMCARMPREKTPSSEQTPPAKPTAFSPCGA